MMERKEIIRLPQIFDCGGRFSSSDKWFIEFYVRNPRNDKMVRFKKYKGINKFHSRKERQEAAEKMKLYWTDKLKSGWTPFADESIIYDDNLQFQTAIKNYRKLKSKNGTFRFFASKYLDFKRKELESASLSTYRSRLRIFDSWLEGKGLNDVDVSCINNQVIVDFSWHIIDIAMLSKTTVMNYQNLLKEVFEHIRKERKQLQNPCFDLPMTLRVSDSAAYPIQEFDIPILKKALKETDPQLWLGCQFVYYCFLRPRKELRFLKIGDIDFGRNIILVRQDNAKTSQRRVSIPKVFMKKLLNEYRLHEYPRDCYVMGKKGKPGPAHLSYNNMGNRHTAIRKKLGLPDNYVMYSWKHTGNIRAADAKIPMRDLQGQNGHTTITTTEIYMKNQQGHRSEYIIDHFPEV